MLTLISLLRISASCSHDKTKTTKYQEDEKDEAGENIDIGDDGRDKRAHVREDLINSFITKLELFSDIDHCNISLPQPNFCLQERPNFSMIEPR